MVVERLKKRSFENKGRLSSLNFLDMTGNLHATQVKWEKVPRNQVNEKYKVEVLFKFFKNAIFQPIKS